MRPAHGGIRARGEREDHERAKAKRGKRTVSRVPGRDLPHVLPTVSNGICPQHAPHPVRLRAAASLQLAAGETMIRPTASGQAPGDIRRREPEERPRSEGMMITIYRETHRRAAGERGRRGC